jgi:hypothetical protein
MARSRSEGIPMGILGTPSVFPRAEARAGIALSAIGIPLLMNKLMKKNDEIARLERELRKAINEKKKLESQSSASGPLYDEALRESFQQVSPNIKKPGGKGRKSKKAYTSK